MTRQPDRLARPIRALVLTVAPGALCMAPSAYARTEAKVTVAASGSVSSNPDMVKDAKAGASGQVVVTPWLRFEDELSEVGASASIQVEKYTSRYETNVSGWASLDGKRRLSEHMTINGGVTYRRSNRILDDFLSRGAGSVTGANGGSGEVQLPTGPLPDVSFGGVRTRNESYEANLNMNIVPSVRGQLSLGIGARAGRFGGSDVNNMNTFSAFAGYSHSLSERTSLNAGVSFSRFDFLGTSAGDGWNIDPHVGAAHKFGDTLELSGNIGASLSRSRLPSGGIRQFTVLSGSLSLCKTADRTKYCLSVERTAEAAALGGASVANTAKLNLATTMGQWATVTADVFYARYDNPTVVTAVGRVSEFIGASASYTRSFMRRRLSVFASPSFIRLKDNSNGARNNLQLRVGVRYSFGGRS